MTNTKRTVIVGIRWLAHYKCAHYSSRHSCDRVELACSSPLSLICASSSSFHPCLSLSPSTFISFNLSPLFHLFPSPFRSLSPPCCCLVKMTECEDMMEYFLSSLWISLCADPHTHTDTNAFASTHTHTERPMHHIKVSRVSLTVMSLISVGYQWGDCHTLQQSTARAFPWEEIVGSETMCHCVEEEELKAEFSSQTIATYPIQIIFTIGKKMVSVYLVWLVFVSDHADSYAKWQRAMRSDNKQTLIILIR